MNGFPVPPGHEQIGLCSVTSQTALVAHVPGQESRHFPSIQAKLLGHSELIKHFCIHFGGWPVYPSWQEHDGVPPIFSHWEYKPQGDGKHGPVVAGSAAGLTGTEIDTFKLCGKYLERKNYCIL